MDGALAYPCLVASGNGTELTLNAILKWQEDRKVEWHYIVLDQPMQNRFVESFNGICGTNVLMSTCSPICVMPAR